jgi:hypothetical protein
MYTVFSVLALAVAALAAPAAEPDTTPVLGVTIGSSTDNSTGPNPSQVTINSISYGGTGCPQGSVGSFISADRTTFVIPNTQNIEIG